MKFKFNKERVILYLRLSDEDHNKLTKEQLSESIKNQELMLKEYALSKNWQIVGIYSDVDWSGGDSTRPEFNKMIKECALGNTDIVLCKTQARFARDSELIEKYVHNKFHEWGIRFKTVVDRIDNEKRETKKTSQILGLTDEWTLEDTSLNIRETFKSKRKAGECTASFAVYGYLKDPENKNHLIPDPVASITVKRIFDEYMKGYGLDKIANGLNEDKILSPLEYKMSNGSKLKIPLLKKYFDYNYIDKVGTYIINVNLINKETQILNNLISFNYITTDMKNFNNKCDITLKRYSLDRTKIYYSEKEALDINKFNENDFILIKENDTIPKTTTCIATVTKNLDRTHIINYQFEIKLKENLKHEKYYFEIKHHVDNKNTNLIFEKNIRRKMKWSEQSIKKILKDEVYIGNMVQFKTTTVSYKNHTIIKNDEEDRIRKNNTHEAIINPSIWYNVQERLKNKSRSSKNGTVHIFSNKIYCMNCNRIFSKCGKKDKNGLGYLCCKDKKDNWTNCDNKKWLKEDELHNFVLEKINNILNKFYDINILNKLNNKALNQDVYKDKLQSLEQEETKIITELQNKHIYFQKLYEDRISGLLKEKEFILLMNKYKDDTTMLEDRLKIIKKEITAINNQKETLNTKQNIFEKYRYIDKLNIEIINNFIDKIIIGSYNKEKNDRDLKIIWNFII